MTSLEKITAISGLLVALGGGAAGAFVPAIFPNHSKGIFWGGAIVAILGAAMLIWAVTRKVDVTMTENKNGPIVGTDIQNSGGGVGVEINSEGTPANPSIGGESSVQVPAGQSAIGTRVIQTGPGTGMRVIQSGPGIGFKSTVIVGGDKDNK